MALFRTLAPGQVTRIHVYDTAAGSDVVVYESREVLFEAPNWSLQTDTLFVNGDGVLWALDAVEGAVPERIDHDALPSINNDHVLDPDGVHVYLSAMDGHIYRAGLAGGPVERVTGDDGVWHYLHGVSPDGQRLAYVRMASFDQPGALAVAGSRAQPDGADVYSILDTGPGHIDGPEWSPDGSWIYFNTERWADAPGHAQIARLPDGGGEVQRLVTSHTVDWFPHLSPDGRTAVYLEFPPGTEGHPADLDVALVVVDVDDWTTPRARIRLPGGQGTINVNSWASDSRRFAYVSYPTQP
ncbi:TolB family protein [Microlunatus ginsengisoli]|uniref:PD40 domain-containing protein n=1 Tax=Microlunatus ginsengisoli TaxID=363863 RepID=A0ABP7AWF5_9ACTN